METTSAARLGLAVVYSGTPNFVRAFQMEAASAACLGIAVRCIFVAMFTAAPLTRQGVPDGNRYCSTPWSLSL